MIVGPLVARRPKLGPQLVEGRGPEVAEESRGHGEDLRRALFLGLDEPPGDELPVLGVKPLLFDRVWLFPC